MSATSIVPVVTVDAVVERFGVSPHVIKIDVEGAEYAVLQGARATLLDARPTIALSLHSERQESMCVEHLKGLGYTFETLGPGELVAKHARA